jgi:hypothetical protein
MKQVVLMMSQGNLVASSLLGIVEELFAAVPGAEEARRLFTSGPYFKTCCDNVQGYTERLTELREVGC